MHTLEQLNAALDGRYAIERQIGAGGMATVYLARDVKHNRQVALKVLNPELGAVLGSERFMSEIEVTANLHHPNLLPLFDSGQATDASGQGAFLYYVMPYIEGETLRTRLQRERQLPVDDAVRIALAIAGALDYAHRHNVIHRDLKPENILMHEGQPLVMDFGIALAVSKAGGARITQTGLSLGTPQYMSPEQATGDHVLDARTDIYSLGAVLYEMLVGDPPHTGSTVQAVIAKVITERPSSVRATRPNVSEMVEAALMTALAKIPADRFSSAADFAAALNGTRPVTMPTLTTQAVAPGVAPGAARRRVGVREGIAWGVAALAVAMIAWSSADANRARAAAEARTTLGRFSLALPDSVVVAEVGRNQSRFALSPDGRYLAFVGRAPDRRARSIYLRRADETTFTEVRGTEGAGGLSFSPDGEWLLFTIADGSLVKVPVGGGAPATVATARGRAQIGSSSWGSGDRIVFAQQNELWVTTAEGAEPRPLLSPDSSRGEISLLHPHILPGGTHALFVILKADSARLAVVALADGKVEELDLEGARPYFVAPGHLVFLRVPGVLYAVDFALRTRKVTGVPARVLDGIRAGGLATWDVALARNGWMAYQSGVASVAATLTVVDRQGRERPLRAAPALYSDPAVSPDGKRVVVTISNGAFNNGDLWVHEIASGAFSRLTTDGNSYRGEWSPDGSRILYVAGQGEETRIVSRPWDGSGAEAVLVRMPRLAEIAPGPARGLSAIRTLTGPRDIFLAPTDSLESMRPFVVGPANETDPVISPDGRWMAYQSDETGQAEVYLRPIPGPGARVAISVGGGVRAKWSSDGRTLYYRSPTRIMAASLAERPEMTVARRDSLFANTYSTTGITVGWDVFPGEREFVLIKSPPQAESDLYVVVNWLKWLKRPGGAEEP